MTSNQDGLLLMFAVRAERLGRDRRRQERWLGKSRLPGAAAVVQAETLSYEDVGPVPILFILLMISHF